MVVRLVVARHLAESRLLQHHTLNSFDIDDIVKEVSSSSRVINSLLPVHYNARNNNSLASATSGWNKPTDILGSCDGNGLLAFDDDDDDNDNLHESD